MYRMTLLATALLVAVLFGQSLPGDDANAVRRIENGQDDTGQPTQTENPAAETPDGDAETDDREMSVWMDRKLKHSQAILRSLAMGDLKDVQYNAARLKLLNRVEGFVRRGNPDYRAHLSHFSRLSSRLEQQAEKGNIEGATLVFNQLTVSCVDCHQMLRRETSESTADLDTSAAKKSTDK